MKDFTEYLIGKILSCKNSITIFDTNQYILLDDCLCLLEQAYNDGLSDANKVKKENNKPLWKDDYNAYISIVEDSKETLLCDNKHKELFLKYNPKCDYQLTLEKSVEMFWGTEEGWEYCKKKRRGKKLDMVATLKKNLERNRVYINTNDSYIQRRIAEIDNKSNKDIFE